MQYGDITIIIVSIIVGLIMIEKWLKEKDIRENHA